MPRALSAGHWRTGFLDIEFALKFGAAGTFRDVEEANST
jgi:hypothetical protein